MPKKKEKIVTLRMNQESYQTIEDYAKVKGLSSPAASLISSSHLTNNDSGSKCIPLTGKC